MERVEAIQHLHALQGSDLRVLADEYGVTVWKQTDDGPKLNKGWAGHVVERYLGLPLNSAQAPNFGSWELKVIPVKRNALGVWRVKETMAITMLDPIEVARNPFPQSHLYRKLARAVIVARTFEGKQETTSQVYRIGEFELSDPIIYNQVEADYEIARSAIVRGIPLTGHMGELVQPRTKGPGHGSTSRAFYARAQFVSFLLGMRETPFRNG